MPSRKELVAYNRDENGIASAIGADLAIFQTLPDLVESVRQWNPKINEFDCSVFTGEYVTGCVDEAYLGHLESLRADNVRGKLQLDTVAATNGVNGNSAQQDKDKLGYQTAGSSPVTASSDTIGLHNSFGKP